MTFERGKSERGAGRASADPGGFENPIDFIAEDHMREREVCAFLDRVAAADVPEPTDLADAMVFLSEDLPLHLADEEEDLFPMMRRRCKPEDEIDKAMGRLISDHAHAKTDTPDVVAALSRIRAGGKRLSSRDCLMLRDFAGHARRHLILENAIILPLARLRLTPKDLRALKARMLERRDPVLGATARHAE